jgi:hypothetical protein
MLEDPDAAHQIVIRTCDHGRCLSVSCTCLRCPPYAAVPLAVKARWQPGEMQRVWEMHMITMREKIAT